MSTLNVNKVDPSTGTALELGSSGDTVSVPSGATLDISASTLTPPATMPASSGINLTALNATNIGSGTVPTARLGTGTASSSTVLYGDQTYKAEPSGANTWVFLQKQTASDDATISFSSTYITDTYPVYKIIVNAMRPTVDSKTCYCELSTDNGSSYASTYDQWQIAYNSSMEYDSGGYNDNTAGNEFRAILATETSPHSGTTPPSCLGGLANSVGNATGEGACGELTFYNLRDSTMYPIFSFSTQMYMENQYLGACNGWAGTRSVTDIDNIKFSFNSGNIDTGTLTLYGLKDS